MWLYRAICTYDVAFDVVGNDVIEATKTALVKAHEQGAKLITVGSIHRPAMVTPSDESFFHGPYDKNGDIMNGAKSEVIWQLP